MKKIITTIRDFISYVMSRIDTPIKRFYNAHIHTYAVRTAFTAVTLALLGTLWSVQYITHETQIKQIVSNYASRFTGDYHNYVATQKADAAEVATTTKGSFQQVVPPLLKRIACGESGNNHIDPNTKQVLINKTLDVGKYQINAPTWGKKAYQLGYDIFTPEGNEAMAIWIYNNFGPSEWVAKPSAKCK